jgi:hypothetical protein
MPQQTESPVLQEAKTADGVGFQLRHDTRGVLEVPGLENVLVGFHIGAPAKLSCLRDGRRCTGTSTSFPQRRRAGGKCMTRMTKPCC